MPWICEFCGRENLQDDRVALQEPACIRCGHRRNSLTDSLTEQIKELRDNYSNLTDWQTDCSRTVQRLEALYDAAWHEVSDLTVRKAAAIDQLSEARALVASARRDLEALEALAACLPDHQGRRLAEDQTPLLAQ